MCPLARRSTDKLPETQPTCCTSRFLWSQWAGVKSWVQGRAWPSSCVTQWRSTT